MTTGHESIVRIASPGKDDKRLYEDVQDVEPMVHTMSQQSPYVDEVFGLVAEGRPNYRNVGWLGAVALMLKTQIGLGVLSIPAIFDVLGLIPGIIMLCFIASLNAWANFEVGVFKNNHRHVYGIDDAGALMFGRIGREILAVSFVLYEILIASAAMLSASIGLNAVSSHGACTAVFVAVAAIVTFALASIRTLGKLTWLVWVGITCIITAGVQDRPASAPQTGAWKSDYQLVGSPSFRQAMSAISSLVFAYAGTPTFFAIASEMRDPKMYRKSLYVTQITVTCLYIAVGIVVYYFCGSYVASPALGSAGPLLKTICYGIALPGLMVTATLLTHVGQVCICVYGVGTDSHYISAKYVFVRLLRGSQHMTNGSAIHWGVWVGCTFGAAVIAYIFASAIPVFDSLISLVGALFATFLSFQPLAAMWLYDNWSKGQRNGRWYGMVVFCTFLIVAGFFIMGASSYSAISDIIDDYRKTGGSAAWSCADNSA